jgi:hypothetical protein
MTNELTSSEKEIIKAFGNEWLGMYRDLIRGGDTHGTAKRTIAGEIQMSRMLRR